MKMWKKMMAFAIGSVMVLSQGMVSFAGEDMAGAGGDAITEESLLPVQGAGIGMSTLEGGIGELDGLVGLAGMGAGADLGFFDTESFYENDTDTCVLSEIQLELKIQGSYMMSEEEEGNFYWIYTWGEQAIPDMVVGAFNWNTTEGFFDKYYEYMKEGRPDITVAEAPVQVTVGDKTLEKVVYHYGIQGYTVQDTRYIWLGPNSILYMFGNSLEDIIAAASVIGAQTPAPAPQPETTAPQPETTAPQPETTTPQPETTAPQPETTAPQPETTAPPAGGNELYTQNDDSSWTVSTKYYTMTIPPAWTGHFDAAVLEQENGGYNLKVVNKESADANFGGHLFTVMLIPEKEDYTYLPSYDYLGTIAAPDGSYSVVIQYPTDLQTGDIWSEFYKILNGDKNTALSSMRPKAGVVWTLPNGNTVSGDSGDSAPQPETTAPQPETPAPQPESTAPQPETTAPQPETTAPQPEPAGVSVLGTTSGSGYSNSVFKMNFNAPAGWILANQDQLTSLNGGLSADQSVSAIEAGQPVCVVYAQSADGMEVMNVTAMNGRSYMDPSMQSLTQEDCMAILSEAMSVSSSSLQALGATVTGTSINTVNCMGQTCYSLDITFNYAGFSGTQKQVGIPMGSYFALITVRSVSGDNTQAMLDMFSAM